MDESCRADQLEPCLVTGPGHPRSDCFSGGHKQVERGPYQDVAVHQEPHDRGVRDVEHQHLQPAPPLCSLSQAGDPQGEADCLRGGEGLISPQYPIHLIRCMSELNETFK